MRRSSAQKITVRLLQAAALNALPAIDMPALVDNGDRYGNAGVYSKSFVFTIACSAIKSVGTQIKKNSHSSESPPTTLGQENIFI